MFLPQSKIQPFCLHLLATSSTAKYHRSNFSFLSLSPDFINEMFSVWVDIKMDQIEIFQVQPNITTETNCSGSGPALFSKPRTWSGRIVPERLPSPANGRCDWISRRMRINKNSSAADELSFIALSVSKPERRRQADFLSSVPTLTININDTQLEVRTFFSCRPPRHNLQNFLHQCFSQ